MPNIKQRCAKIIKQLDLATMERNADLLMENKILLVNHFRILRHTKQKYAKHFMKRQCALMVTGVISSTMREVSWTFRATKSIGKD